LFSIFVIMVGLLGVAAVLPLAGYQMSHIATTDSAAVCARAAMRDLSGRSMLVAAQPASDNPAQLIYNWSYYNSTGGAWAWYKPPVGTMGGTAPDKGVSNPTFVLDPLGVAQYSLGGNTPPAFPYSAAADSTSTQTPPVWPARLLQGTKSVQMLRVSLCRGSSMVSGWSGLPLYKAGSPTYTAIPQAIADRLFTLADDVNVPPPTDPTERPRQIVYLSGQGGAALPLVPAAGNQAGGLASGTNPLQAIDNGNYSWMAMVTFSPDEAQLSWNWPTPPAPLPWKNFTVDVVVFYKRQFEPNLATPTIAPPLERTVWANLLSGGYAGGEVKLTAPVVDPNKNPIDPQYLTVKKDQWILLAGVDNDGMMVYRWYRVVNPGGDPVVDPNNNNLWARYVSLAGPDWVFPQSTTAGGNTVWSNHWCDKTTTNANVTGTPPVGPSPSNLAPADSDGDTTTADVVAILVDGVVGVYTTTIRLQ
jgi:hypothetical protein